ncbi:mechanosensitive ion channel protein 2, chloroplastic-like [Dorcoceras hygrometricum]|uniref:Mechanosensitive ion channel protein 2, chloroplastic-like n=1 Tax=Dorcoceras hygrometricum TaxID=472368 RepID=A0A2Z7AUL3_9LAMI|nr:mechanosensitive ion channel protein 2, chloroplastic-like [Dorcoceras hygrometricum]
MKSLLRYKEHIRSRLVKEKPAGQDIQEQIKEEGTISSKVMKCGRNLLYRGTLRSEDDEDQLKSSCKREQKKRALSGSMKQPAQVKTSSVQNRTKKCWQAG